MGKCVIHRELNILWADHWKRTVTATWVSVSVFLTSMGRRQTPIKRLIARIMLAYYRRYCECLFQPDELCMATGIYVRYNYSMHLQPAVDCSSLPKLIPFQCPEHPLSLEILCTGHVWIGKSFILSTRWKFHVALQADLQWKLCNRMSRLFKLNPNPCYKHPAHRSKIFR